MKSKVKTIAIISLAGLFLISNFASAALVNCGGKTQEPCELTDLIFIIVKIINTLLGLSWLVAVFYVFWAGFTMITAYGNPEGLEVGKKTFRNAIVGFFMILVAFILVNWIVFTLTGLNLKSPEGNPDSIYHLFPINYSN